MSLRIVVRHRQFLVLLLVAQLLLATAGCALSGSDYARLSYQWVLPPRTAVPIQITMASGAREVVVTSGGSGFEVSGTTTLGAPDVDMDSGGGWFNWFPEEDGGDVSIPVDSGTALTTVRLSPDAQWDFSVISTGSSIAIDATALNLQHLDVSTEAGDLGVDFGLPPLHRLTHPGAEYVVPPDLTEATLHTGDTRTVTVLVADKVDVEVVYAGGGSKPGPGFAYSKSRDSWSLDAPGDRKLLLMIDGGRLVLKRYSVE